MHDEYDGRLWQAHHGQLTAAASQAAGLIGVALSHAGNRARLLLSAVMLAAVLVTATVAAAETAAIIVFTQGATNA